MIQITLVNGYKYNPDKNTIETPKEEIKLTANENKLLKLLLKNKDKIVNSEEIKYHVWNDDYATDGALKAS